MSPEAPEATPTTSSISVVELGTLLVIFGFAVVSTIALLLAHVGARKDPLVWVLTLVVAVVIFTFGRRFGWPRPRLDVVSVVPAVVGFALSCWFFWPGFGFSTGDRDPGAYLEHAVLMHRHSSVQFDWIVAKELPDLTGKLEIWPAMWTAPGDPSQIRPQFYHLWPALLSVANGVAGFAGMTAMSVLSSIVAVVAGVCVGRRFAGWPGAWVMALLMPTNMLNVWQAKYPTSETFSQMLYLGAILAFVLSMRTGSRACGWLAGTLAVVSFVARPDAIIIWLAALGILALILATRHWDGRATWAAIGVGALTPFALWQGYGYALNYTMVNGMPSLKLVLLAVAGMFVVAAVLALVPGPVRWLTDLFSRPVRRRQLGLVLLLVCTILFVIGLKRPELWGPQYFLYNGDLIRSYDELNWIRLGWFFTVGGLLLALIGVGYLAWRRWRFDRWMVTLLTLAMTILYCYQAKNSAYMMWSTRRFVPTVVPGLYLLIGCGVAALSLALVAFGVRLARQRGLDVPSTISTTVSAVIVAGLLASPLTSNVSQSAPLRSHHENAGAWQVAREIGSVSRDPKAIFLWTQEPCCAPLMLFGGPMMTIDERLSLRLKPETAQAATAELHQFAQANNRPLFIVQSTRNTPPAGSTKVKRVKGRLEHWEETFIKRPTKDAGIVYDVTVWKVTS